MAYNYNRGQMKDYDAFCNQNAGYFPCIKNPEANDDIIWFFSNSTLSNDQYVELTDEEAIAILNDWEDALPLDEGYTPQF